MWQLQSPVFGIVWPPVVIVPDIRSFSTHSLTAGDASAAAANAGVEDRLFQRHGRWKSVSAKNGYIDDSLVSTLSVSQSMGI